MLLLALFLSAALLGGMLFFALGFAPLVFMKLPPEQAGRFIRAVFPVYYTFSAVLAGLAALVAVLAGAWAHAAVLLAVLLGFLLARFVLMPAVNRARDGEIAGDGAAKQRFARLHRASVAINGLQIVALGAILGLAMTA